MVSTHAVRFASIALVASQLVGAEMVIPNGTKLAARLEQTISSATAEQGQQVQLSVTEPVKVNGVVVIPQGAPILGTIVLAQEKKTMGRAGKLDFSVDKVRAADGEYIPLRYTMQKKAGEGKGTSTGIMTAGAAVLFWPAAPFFLLRKGKDVTINKGIVLEVFTDQDHSIGAAAAAAPAVPAPQTLAPAGPQVMLAGQSQQPAAPGVSGGAVALAAVAITSDLSGAEIEVDGVFIGSTPGTAKVAPGMHKITVKHGANVWSRDLIVQPGGNVNVNAILRK
jgi:hypothetical protein